MCVASTSGSTEPLLVADLRLVSWNVHALPGAPDRAGRLARVADWLLADGDAAPDVVALQEVWTREDAEPLVERLAPVYESVGTPPNWFGFRKGGLLAFVRRASGWRVDRDTRRTRFHEFRAEAPDWRLWEGDGFGDKGVQRVELVGADDARLVVLNTHLQAQYLHGWTAVRRAQLAELELALGPLEGDPPVLLAGDLNTRADEPFFRDALLTRWIDLTVTERVRCGCGTAVPTPSPQDPAPEPHWIDFVMARRDPAWRFEMRGLERILSPRPDHPYSDHHGLDARLRMARSSHADFPAFALAVRLLVGPSSRRAWLVGLALSALGPCRS